MYLNFTPTQAQETWLFSTFLKPNLICSESPSCKGDKNVNLRHSGTIHPIQWTFTKGNYCSPPPHIIKTAIGHCNLPYPRARQPAPVSFLNSNSQIAASLPISGGMCRGDLSPKGWTGPSQDLLFSCCAGTSQTSFSLPGLWALHRDTAERRMHC